MIYIKKLRPPEKRKISTSIPTAEGVQEHARDLKDAICFDNFNKYKGVEGQTEPPCQCTLIGRLTSCLSKGFSLESYEVVCDCGNTMILPAPKAAYIQKQQLGVYDLLTVGSLDPFFTSKYSLPSIDQPGHGGCVFTGIMKWTYDERAVKLINDAYLPLGFNKMIRMNDTRTRMLFSLYSYAFVSGEKTCGYFVELMNNIDDTGDEVILNHDILDVENLDAICEWMLIALARYFADGDVLLEAKLRRDITSFLPHRLGREIAFGIETFAATDFIELLYPVKYAIFSDVTGLCDLCGSDVHLFERL